LYVLIAEQHSPPDSVQQQRRTQIQFGSQHATDAVDNGVPACTSTFY
jgi:hypothetical protein